MGGPCDVGVFQYDHVAGEDLCQRGRRTDAVFESDEVCEVSYKDRGGKYQGQRGVTLPKA